MKLLNVIAGKHRIDELAPSLMGLVIKPKKEKLSVGDG